MQYMKIKACTINPQYAYLKVFIDSLPFKFTTSGDVIYKGRNELRRFNIDGLSIVVKSFKVPHFVNKIAYSYFRKSKAQRSYEYGLRLLSLGIHTPDPIAFIEIQKNGLLTNSYYICLASDYTTFRDIYDQQLEDKLDIVKGVGYFAAKIQKQGVIHKDFTQGNILFKKSANGEILFSLIDINRLIFSNIDIEKGCLMFKGMWESEEAIKEMANAYAKSMGYNERQVENLVLENVVRFRNKNRFKKFFKRKRNK